jgi:hypothetical protein
MVLNRVLAPASKLRVYEWLEGVHGAEEESLSLHHLYRALDLLDAHQEEIETRLFERLKHRFNLKAHGGVLC